MSQVQVRQVPLATSTDAQRIIGSWFPTGYYGHFRARSRADLCNYFRHLARPEPPKRFLDRQHAEAALHVFSQHDNRFRFEKDPLVRTTQTGFGKRKSKNNLRGEFDPLFVSWVPKNVDRKAFVDEPKITSYAEEYNHDVQMSRTLSAVQAPISTPVSQNDRPETATSETGASVYSETYRHGQPDTNQSKEIRRETYQRFLTTRSRLLQNKANDRSPSVASCLVWTSSQKETTKNSEPVTKVVGTVTLEEHFPLNANATRPQRAQSAAARLTTVPTSPPIPPAAKPFQSSSMQTFGTASTSTQRIERPHTATTTSRDHFNGAHFIEQKSLPPRAVTSFEPKHVNNMDSLISKYM